MFVKFFVYIYFSTNCISLYVHSGSLMRISHSRFVWLTLFLLNVFTALKVSHFYFLFVYSAHNGRHNNMADETNTYKLTAGEDWRSGKA